jgi:aerobic C4-dicarboxylate transport protein
MSEARAITNTIGNAVGTVAIGRWVGAVDRQRLARVLEGESDDPEALRQLYEGDDAEASAKPAVVVEHGPRLAA